MAVQRACYAGDEGPVEFFVEHGVSGRLLGSELNISASQPEKVLVSLLAWGQTRALPIALEIIPARRLNDI